MKELSLKEIRRYNYSKVKDYVEDELAYLSHLGTKLSCLLPPDAGRQMSFMERVDGIKTIGSKQEKYVEKKDILEQEIKKELNRLEDNLKLMTKDELLVFEEVYIYQSTDETLEERYCWSRNKILHMKKSFSIKLALSMGMDFEK